MLFAGVTGTSVEVAGIALDRVVGFVSAEAPDGLGTHDGVWEETAESHDKMMAAWDALRRGDTKKTRRDFTAAARVWMTEWRKAAKLR
jgi:hypothetical protein